MVNNELDKVLKAAVVARSEVLSRNFVGGVLENHKKKLSEDVQVQVRSTSLFYCNKGQVMCMDTIPLSGGKDH
jgi:uncharacterized protein with von Willebrand factor type A (vWA) domain